ncbi:MULTISPECIES: HDIG domain-containing metalloprotein [unclassified Clostridium]|uniref:HD superfamily hydrolase n=1 Tax=Clostridium botulinum (strain Eklund 17B / Type B) TaxID=935198 RepID=B2TR78_CLOBB|nr:MULTISPECIES: HDIG domain-containing metalloprotein [unclassified Clostridium]ACD23838.1 HD superfamily hydrolase [Clostridium botulinum B str. Eklund 17B (NRP)]MBN1046871.1 HDIG domain-containing protein [Clostridium botulinum]MBY6977712.1 HDIG domain-containing protein [Clostridium botulinum]MBY7002176.1 HDIG domain-containing protein [Clostridium botulinum]MCR1275843.1 HDIG domain-containing protein [Clostridium botulinum]
MEEKKIFLEIEKHLLNDEKPSLFLNEALHKGSFDEYPLSMIKDLKEVPQNPKYHPEGNVFIHTMMVVDEGAKRREISNDKRTFMWTLLLHDIGKKPTTKMRKGRLISYDHDKVGAEMAEEFLNYFNENKDFVDYVRKLIRWHMQSLFVVKNTRFQDIEGILRDISVDDIALVSLCDRLGRGGLDDSLIEQTKNDIEFFKKVLNSRK